MSILSASRILQIAGLSSISSTTVGLNFNLKPLGDVPEVKPFGDSVPEAASEFKEQTPPNLESAANFSAEEPNAKPSTIDEVDVEQEPGSIEFVEIQMKQRKIRTVFAIPMTILILAFLAFIYVFECGGDLTWVDYGVLFSLIILILMVLIVIVDPNIFIEGGDIDIGEEGWRLIFGISIVAVASIVYSLFFAANALIDTLDGEPTTFASEQFTVARAYMTWFWIACVLMIAGLSSASSL